ncbi:MAG: hypothetical protein K2X87_25780 [Gemmataceae bacterium]|nr:hypothetical protein [Gemmataceae bacterium]
MAYRMALRHRTRTARRRLEQAAGWPPRDVDDPLSGVEDEEVWAVLREEFDRLPDKYRVPLALCYLDGRTHAEVGRAVGLPRGSVAERIGRGLDRLRERRAARGVLP